MSPLKIALFLWLTTTHVIGAEGELRLQPIPSKFTTFGAGTILTIGEEKVFACEFGKSEWGLVKLNGRVFRLSRQNRNKSPKPNGGLAVNDEIKETWYGESIVIDLDFKITEQAECVSYLAGKMTVRRNKKERTFEFSGVSGCELNM